MVDLVFGGVTWGKLQLPEVVTASSGADVVCAEQEVKILNQDAFRAFVKALMLDKELVLRLDNGDCKIAAKILGFTAKSNVVYKKDLVIKGMQGPRVTLKDCSGGKNTFAVENPSPLEINHGISMFDIVSGDEVVAQLKGPLNIVRGNFDSTLDITFNGKKVAPGTKVRLAGTGTEKDSWMNDTLKYINSEFEVSGQFAALSG